MLRSTITCLLSLHVCKIDGQVWGFELHGDACSTVSVRLRTTLVSKCRVELEWLEMTCFVTSSALGVRTLLNKRASGQLRLLNRITCLAV